jgi:beta-phosphoglucomutase
MKARVSRNAGAAVDGPWSVPKSRVGRWICKDAPARDSHRAQKMLKKIGSFSAGMRIFCYPQELDLTHSSSTLQAVIFDCDGVLVDTEPLHYRAFQEVLAPLGLAHSYAHYLEHFIGFDDRDAFLHAFKEAGRALGPEGLARLTAAKEQALEKIVLEGVPTFPGVVELVRDLASHGTPLAIASGALRHEVYAFVASLGLDGLFSVVVAADEVKRSKPDPETYLAALNRLREMPGNGALGAGSCIAVEDTPAGIASARGAGLFVVGVTNSFPKEDLGGADLVVESLAGMTHGAMAGLLARRFQAGAWERA